MLNYSKLETIEYVNRLIAGFAGHAHEGRAVKMSAYMKNRFDFFGIQSPERKLLFRAFTSEFGYPEVDKLDEVVKELWSHPRRELHYVAQELASAKVYMSSDSRIQLIEYMITNNSWWDTVDFIASNLAGPWFMKHPDMISNVTETWMVSGNLWLQRSALLFQLKYKKKTDEDLLFKYIHRLAAEPDFFIRKAIGWALREYSKSNPTSVISFVNNEKLSALSKKEALKSVSSSLVGKHNVEANNSDKHGENNHTAEKDGIITVPTTTWYLEMTRMPSEIYPEKHGLDEKAELHIGLPAGYSTMPFNGGEHASPAKYLETYKAVGDNYNWYDRLLMPAEELEAILSRNTTEIWFLKYGEEVAGFVEYDHSTKGETEIVYFGLTTGHTGKKAGYPFLLWAINHAWQKPITRLWLHTCDLDHPAALPLYQKAGFCVYKIETVMQRVKAKG